MNDPYQYEWDDMVDNLEDNAESSRSDIAGGDEELEQMLEDSDNRVIEELRNM